MKDQSNREYKQEKNGLAKENIQNIGQNLKTNKNTEGSIMTNFNLSENVKGYIYLAAGTFLLLYTLGYFQAFNLIFVIGSIALMFWGALKANLFEHLYTFINYIKEKFSKK